MHISIWELESFMSNKLSAEKNCSTIQARKRFNFWWPKGSITDGGPREALNTTFWLFIPEA